MEWSRRLRPRQAWSKTTPSRFISAWARPSDASRHEELRVGCSLRRCAHRRAAGRGLGGGQHGLGPEVDRAPHLSVNRGAGKAVRPGWFIPDAPHPRRAAAQRPQRSVADRRSLGIALVPAQVAGAAHSGRRAAACAVAHGTSPRRPAAARRQRFHSAYRGRAFFNRHAEAGLAADRNTGNAVGWRQCAIALTPGCERGTGGTPVGWRGRIHLAFAARSYTNARIAGGA